MSLPTRCERPGTHKAHHVLDEAVNGGYGWTCAGALGGSVTSDRERFADLDWARPITAPEAAAWGAITGRKQVEYQPGDGARYDLVFAVHPHDEGRVADPRPRGMFVLLNHHCATVPVLDRGAVTCERYCRWQHAPVGSWRAMRPLLAYYGVATGPLHIDNHDAVREAEVRANGADGAPLYSDDAILGRAVRRLVVKQSREGVPAPVEVPGGGE